MERRNNYDIQQAQARNTFLTMDQAQLIAKNHLRSDEAYLYTVYFSREYRIDRRTAEFAQKQRDGTWSVCRSFGTVMTILDLLCDSRADRMTTGKMQSMSAFGMHIHSGLAKQTGDTRAAQFEAAGERFVTACRMLGGQITDRGDLSIRFPVFESLCLELVLWYADEEFPASLTWFWDENALQYLHYETMYYCLDGLIDTLETEMERLEA